MKLTTALKHVIAWTRRLGIEEGQDLLEYALLCALIALVAIGAVTAVGQTIYDVFWKGIAGASF